jgi:WD40 repeat protein
MLFAADDDGSVRLLKSVSKAHNTRESINDIVISPDYSTIATACDCGCVKTWNASTCLFCLLRILCSSFNSRSSGGGTSSCRIIATSSNTLVVSCLSMYHKLKFKFDSS